MDDDDKKPEDAAAEPARDAAQEEGAKLREVSEDELKRILAAHKTWLETDGEKGKQADLADANLQGAALTGANLQGAFLTSANLQGAYLRWADLREAHLYRANLQGAFLTGAKLQGADLQGAALTGANLQGADLSDAKLQGVDLRGADLRRAQNLTREQLDGACGDDKTKLPDDLADYQMKPCPEPEQSPSN